MKMSHILHGVADIAGIVGLLALIGAWSVGDGTFLGMSQDHLFKDTMSILLVSIAFGVLALIHQNEEKK